MADDDATGGLGPVDAFGTSRTSRLFPGDGRCLAHADLHNHTLFSDGQGDPEKAFTRMREAGLDVAALTDHAGVRFGPGHAVAFGVDDAKWERIAALADAELAEGRFVAIRGFEWTTVSLGHANVWLSEGWVNPLDSGGVGRDAGMAGFYAWLRDQEGGLAGLNHPGREPGRFADFAYEPAVADRVVGLEVFNRGDDYLFEGTDRGMASPVVACLDAGWRVGLTGVSDEHGDDWGDHPEKGRTGLYVGSLTRGGVREALCARRSFAAVVAGLRLDASLGGVRMGGVAPASKGPVRVELDVDRGEAWRDKRLGVQLLRPGGALPDVACALEVRVPGPGEPVVAFDAELGGGSWAILRVTDPEAPADPRAPERFAAFGGAVAYASPWYFGPGEPA